MKAFFSLVLFGGLLGLLKAEVSLQGVRSEGSRTFFLLTDDAGQVSPWLSLGETFDGYQLEKFDSQDASLTLRKEGRNFRVVLTRATIQQAILTTPNSLPFAPWVVMIEGQPEVVITGDENQLNGARELLVRLAKMSPAPHVQIFLGRNPEKARVERLLRTASEITRDSKLTLQVALRSRPDQENKR